MKKFVISTILFLAAVAGQLVVSNVFAGGGQELASVEKRIEQVKRENSILREKVGSASSLQQIAAAAALLGLVRPTSIIYIDLPAASLSSGLSTNSRE